ncbi:hypothetical protein PHAVU_011G028300 [Phaseolus vulgaris]|uniref:Uncharacterized protein n=1 Tax=Phaseolus vulgaris TaxID=3885 RepID=V7AHR3_PHAVU|nr:hypothetical protein PHAVU_011G028300g [Phaseolus vulgaris]ESW03611.1 hypothetical protein PHAVU_011G028300g [Phaseolus vulgaris]
MEINLGKLAFDIDFHPQLEVHAHTEFCRSVCTKVWDTRERPCCNSFNAHEDYISDMTFAFDARKLLTTSGDGTLSV